MKEIKKDIRYLFFIFLSFIIIEYPLFTGKMPFDFDNLAFYHPMFSLSQIRPIIFWDPYQFSGFPIFAEPQFAMFYPLRIIFYFLNIFPAMSLFYILHNILGIIFMFYFLRSLELCRISSTGGTLCYIHGSYWQGKMMMTGTLFFSMIWIPLFFLFAFRAIDRSSLKSCIIAGWILGIIALIGSPHHIFYPILVLGIYLIFHKFWYHWDSIRYFVLILFVGFGIGAIQLIPTQELFAQSVRAHLTLDQITQTPLETRWILGSFLGGTQTGEFLDASAYFGVTGLILILFAFLYLGKKEKKLWFLLILFIIAFIIARGKDGYIYYLFYKLPFLKTLSFPCRSLILVAFVGSVLTAYGIDNILQIKPKDISKSFIILLLTIILISVLGLIVLYYLTGNSLILSLVNTKWADPVLFRWSNLAFFTMMMGILVFLFWKNKLSSSTFGFLILGILFIDLYHFTPRIQKQFVNAQEYLTPPVWVNDLKKQIVGAQFIAPSIAKQPVRVLGFEGSRIYAIDQNDNRFKDYLTPRLSELYRFQDPQGYDPLVIQKYANFMDILAGRSQKEELQRTATIENCNPRFLNLMNVGYIVGEPHEFTLFKAQAVFTYNLSTTFTVSTSIPCVELGIISLLDQHLNTSYGAVIGDIVVTGTKGEKEIFPIRAGIETADWRAGSLSSAHPFLIPSMTWRGLLGGREMQLHNFHARFMFSKSFIPQSITFQHAHTEGVWVVQHISLIKHNDDTQFEKIKDYGEIRIYRNKTVYPRAFLVHQIESISNDSLLLNKLADSETDLHTIAYLSEPLKHNLSHQTSPSEQDIVAFTTFSPNAFTLESNSKENSFLVLSEIYYPGWKAWVDGKLTKIYKTNYILRGIYLEPGKHTIFFKYQPNSFRVGISITLLTLILSFLAIFPKKSRL